ncbi:MAG: hypothetical protein Q8R36_04750 [bacterium]|nr:hypothetical protein [bacterium]
MKKWQILGLFGSALFVFPTLLKGFSIIFYITSLLNLLDSELGMRIQFIVVISGLAMVFVALLGIILEAVFNKIKSRKSCDACESHGKEDFQ